MSFPHSTLSSREILAAWGLHFRPPLPMIVLALLATRRRLLLVGLPGQAKTLLARRLGEALGGGHFRLLNAATSDFAEIRGYIRPRSLNRGKLEIVPGPWSVYDSRFVFIDEISRAPLHAQNRWLQLAHERLMDGLPTRIEHVLAAMNPPEVDGCFPLGIATADRFHAAVWMDSFGSLGREEQLRIAAGESGDDEATAGKQLTVWVDAVCAAARAIESHPTLPRMMAGLAVAAVTAWDRTGHPFRPQGRRVVALREVLVSLLAALTVELGDPDSAANALGQHLDAVVSIGLTHIARAADHEAAGTRRAHEAAFDAVCKAWSRSAALPADESVADSTEDQTRKRALSELRHPTLSADECRELLCAWQTSAT
ncbi:MAG: AAA family ATPase [Planctomycetota bacterium]